jgi:hypothetical protein
LHSGQPFLLSREAIIIVLFCFISCTTAWRLVLVFFLFFFFAFFFPSLLSNSFSLPFSSFSSPLSLHRMQRLQHAQHTQSSTRACGLGWWMAMHLSCRGHGLRLRGVMRHDVARRDMPGGFCMYGILWRRGGQDFNSMFVCATSCARVMLFLCCLTCMALASVQRGVSGVLTRLSILRIHTTVHV